MLIKIGANKFGQGIIGNAELQMKIAEVEWRHTIFLDGSRIQNYVIKLTMALHCAILIILTREKMKKNCRHTFKRWWLK